MKVIISGYGKMGHMVEAALQRRGIELVCASEDICAIPKEVAKEIGELYVYHNDRICPLQTQARDYSLKARSLTTIATSFHRW